MDGQEHHNENPNQYQGMLRFFANRLIEPINEFLHPAWRLEWRRRFEHDAQTFAIRAKGFYMVRHFFVVSAMLLILAAVFEKNAVELLDVVFGDRYGLETLENHVHRIGIAGDLLLIAARERSSLHAREQLFYLPIAELCAFDTGGGANALNRGDPPQGSQLLRRKRLHHLPTPLELIDLRDELQDFRRDRDVRDLVGTDIHLYPFIPDF